MAETGTQCWCGREVLLTCKCGARPCIEHTMICSMLSCKCKQMMCGECLDAHQDAVLFAKDSERAQIIWDGEE
jgi:hypothetical protein